MNAAMSLLTGNETEADIDRIRSALTAWLVDPDTDGPSLQAYLGINRAAARKALRDRHLRAAAGCLPDLDPWPRSKLLAEAARSFTVRRWPDWRRSGPPSTATDLDLELYRARQYGDVFLSARQLYRITARLHVDMQTGRNVSECLRNWRQIHHRDPRCIPTLS